MDDRDGIRTRNACEPVQVDASGGPPWSRTTNACENRRVPRQVGARNGAGSVATNLRLVELPLLKGAKLPTLQGGGSTIGFAAFSRNLGSEPRFVSLHRSGDPAGGNRHPADDFHN